MAPTINIIVAVDQNMGIGYNGHLPWKMLKGDMKYFKRMTTSKTPGKTTAVIMGRKTWESIPEKNRPLANRMNIVLSKTMPETCLEDGFIIERNIQNITKYQNMTNIESIWIIGGAAIFKEVLNSSVQIYRLYITRIIGTFNNDVYFPYVDFEEYVKINTNDDLHIDNGIYYKFEIYEKI